jgi:hypothetical protein
MHLSSRDHGRPAAGRAIAIAWGATLPLLASTEQSQSGVDRMARLAASCHGWLEAEQRFN